MKVIILGAGPAGRTIAEVLRDSGDYDIVCFLDNEDTDDEEVLGPVRRMDRFRDGETFMLPAFEDAEQRAACFAAMEELGIPPLTYVHESAYVSPTAAVDTGVVILQNAVIQADAYVKRGSIVMANAVIEGGAEVGENATVRSNASVRAGEKVPAGGIV